MSKPLQIALAQINLTVGDVDGNAQKVIEYSQQAKASGADLVVFPELTLCGYPPEDLLHRASLLEWCSTATSDIAAQVGGIDVLIGLPIQDEGGLRNAAVVLRDGGIFATYYKSQLPNYGVFDEKRYFVEGDQPLVFECQGVQVGITVCEDIWLPEPAEQAKAAGAELLVNLNASPYHINKQPKRVATLRERNAATGLPIVYVNAVGGQDELVFDGQSFVINASGQICWHADEVFEETLGIVEFPFAEVEQSIEPQDGGLAEIYDALVCGVRDYVHKNNFPGVLLGLSGGIDSALTLAIAADALGPENVNVLLMPSRYTAQMSNDDALEEANILGVQSDIINIEPAFNTFLDMLKPLFKDAKADTTEENIQARSRGILLMAMSNKTGRMLLTTGNKSEMAVGYATLYGDMAGGYNPLKDVYKTLVFDLCRFRNTRGYVIPERVITRPPSAELREDQQDSDSLPDYPILDAILSAFIDDDKSIANIVAEGFEEATVKRVTHMVLQNEYKRRQAPPGVRITQKGFGKDRRYPITSGFSKIIWKKK